MRNKILLLALGLTLTGCTMDGFPKYQAIDRLRVLALKTATPEISPGDTVPAVSSLVYDPKGAGRTISYSWFGCLESFTDLSTRRFACENASDKISLGTGTSSTGGVVTIPATILDSLSGTLAYNGISYIVGVVVTAGSEQVTAFKRIVISQSGKTKNSNPAITNLTRAGVALSNGDAVGSSDAEITASVTAGSFESYNYKDADGNLKTATEDILLSWFTTEGTWKNTRTFQGNLLNTFTPPVPKLAATVSLVVVAHDSRGGVEWATVDLQ